MSEWDAMVVIRLVAVCREWHDEYHPGAIFTLCSHHRCQEAMNAVTLVPAGIRYTKRGGLTMNVDERILRKILGVDFGHESQQPYASNDNGWLVVDGSCDLTDDESARVNELLALRP